MASYDVDVNKKIKDYFSNELNFDNFELETINLGIGLIICVSMTLFCFTLYRCNRVQKNDDLKKKE